MKQYPEDLWIYVAFRKYDGVVDSHYKVFWIGNEIGNGGVGIILAEEWVEKVYDICRISDRLMMIKLAIDNNIITVLSCYVNKVTAERP